jgi:hypothetical protein
VQVDQICKLKDSSLSNKHLFWSLQVIYCWRRSYFWDALLKETACFSKRLKNIPLLNGTVIQKQNVISKQCQQSQHSRLSQLHIWGLLSPSTWRCVTGNEVFDVSNLLCYLVFNISNIQQQYVGHFELLRWNHFVFLKRLELLSQWHKVTFYKNGGLTWHDYHESRWSWHIVGS